MSKAGEKCRLYSQESVLRELHAENRAGSGRGSSRCELGKQRFLGGVGWGPYKISRGDWEAQRTRELQGLPPVLCWVAQVQGDRK